MSVKPLHDRLFAQRVQEEESIAGGIIIPDTAKEKPQRGRVAAVGTGRRSHDGSVLPLDVQVGDEIIFGKFSGADVVVDGEVYLVLREVEVLAIVGEAAATRN